jgi:twitching motility protein PilT
MVLTPAIRNLIREGKSFQIPSMIQTGRKEGMQSMDDHLYELLMANFITRESAVAFALDQTAMIDKTAMFI